MTMSDQWEHYLQGFSYEMWDGEDPPEIIGHDRFDKRFRELREERLGQVEGETLVEELDQDKDLEQE